MFKRLKYRILFVNMIITSIVVIISFIAVYLITYNNIEEQIILNLEQRPVLRVENSLKEIEGEYREKINEDISYQLKENSEESLQVVSYIDLSKEDYNRICNVIKNDKSNNNKIKVNNRTLRYSILEESYQIKVLDVTQYENTLNNLLWVLLIVGITMIFVIFIISYFFAKRAVKPIREMWENQKRFVADASHELKTPISIINANYDVLVENKNETIVSQMKWLQYMEVGLDRMTDLINSFITLTKIEDNSIELKEEAVCITKVIEDIINTMEARVNTKKIIVKRDIYKDIVIKTDLEKIQELITILIDNAIKYTEINGEITIKLIKVKKGIIFTVGNTGKGILEKDLEKIFERFYRCDSSRSQKNSGHGLGLSIAKAIVDKLNGKIKAESIEGSYTKFIVEL